MANRQGSWACDASKSVKFNNCFASGNPLNIEPMPNAYTIMNVVSSTDEGYDVQEAAKALNAVAKDAGYGEWVLGKLDDGRVVPELKAFCKQCYCFGLMLLVR